MYISITWDGATPDAWPKHLPFNLKIPFGTQAWYIILEGYGRGVDLTLGNEVREALGWFIHGLTTEGPQTGIISKQSYYHAFVKLQIGGRRPGDSKAGVTRGEMVELVKGVRAIFFTPHNWGPREFVGQFFGPGTPLVGMTLSFIDPP